MVGGQATHGTFLNVCTDHCQRTLNWLRFRWCHFVIKSVPFQHLKFSKVAKMIYNSISDVCSVIFVPNLAIQSLEFDHTWVQTWQKNFKSSIMADMDILTSHWFSACLHSHVRMESEIVGKFKMTYFWCRIY